MWASRNGYSEVIKLLHQYGAQMDQQDYEGKTALMMASENGHSDIIKLLQEWINNERVTDTAIQTDFCNIFWCFASNNLHYYALVNCILSSCYILYHRSYILKYIEEAYSTPKR